MTMPAPQSADMEEFLGYVGEYAGLSSLVAAERVTRATLSILAQRITAGQVADLSAGLPDELRSELHQRTGQAEAFDKSTFLDKVSGEIDTVDMEEVEKQVRAVLRVVWVWAPAGEINDTLEQLPRDLSALFPHP